MRALALTSLGGGRLTSLFLETLEDEEGDLEDFLEESLVGFVGAMMVVLLALVLENSYGIARCEISVNRGEKLIERI